MRFRFPLAAVLRLREIAEEREERLLSEILRRIVQTREALDQLDAAMVVVAERRNSGLRASLSAAELQASYREVEALRAARQEHSEQLGKLEQLRLQQLAIYHAAHRGRRMLTEMRAEQRARFEATRAREEQKAADDLFLARHRRG
jgi:flagellar FliJ protein